MLRLSWRAAIALYWGILPLLLLGAPLAGALHAAQRAAAPSALAPGAHEAGAHGRARCAHAAPDRVHSCALCTALAQLRSAVRAQAVTPGVEPLAEPRLLRLPRTLVRACAPHGHHTARAPPLPDLAVRS